MTEAGRRPDVPDPGDERTLRCGTCDRMIDVCAFCEQTGCDHVICHRCLRLAFRESIALPHPHGG
jgi:hypothetical protein